MGEGGREVGGRGGDASKKKDKHLKQKYHGSHQKMIGIKNKFACRV